MISGEVTGPDHPLNRLTTAILNLINEADVPLVTSGPALINALAIIIVQFSTGPDDVKQFVADVQQQLQTTVEFHLSEPDTVRTVQ